jgi:hypothetical protein
LDEVLDVHPPATEAPGDPVGEVQREDDGLASQLGAPLGVRTVLDLGEEGFGAFVVTVGPAGLGSRSWVGED